MTVRFTEGQLRGQATYYCGRTRDMLLYAAEVVRRANEVRGDTLNGVVNYILNGREDGKEEQGS